MTENIEGNYTKEDLKQFNLNDQEIEEIIGHGLGDGEKDFTNEIEEVDNEIIGKTGDGRSIYRAEEIKYKSQQQIYKEKAESLLNQTPEKKRRYLMPGTLVKQEENNRFRKGFIDKESIVERILNKKSKPVVVSSLYEYMALTPVEFSYLPKNSDTRIHFVFNSGEKFFAPKSGEKKKETK